MDLNYENVKQILSLQIIPLKRSERGRFCPHFEVQQLDMYDSEWEMYNYMHILPTDSELIETALL